MNLTRTPWRGAVVLALCLAAATPVHADLTVKYRAVHSELVLFGRLQESPFARVSYTLYLKGTRMRTELVDHVGRRYWLLADRATGEAYGLDPETRTYWKEGGAWFCADVAEQVARAAAQLLSEAGVESLQVDPAVVDKLGERDVQRIEAPFGGRVLGAPQPVAADLTLLLPRAEEAVLGTAQADLYCGRKPTRAVWEKAFRRHLPVAAQAATELGRVAALPLRVGLRAELAIGQAAVTLDAVEIRTDGLPDVLFLRPPDFVERR